jgi:hypothetical protein
MLREHTATGEQPGDRSVVVCMSMGGPGDDLATEILVRMLRSLRLDARDLTIEDLRLLKHPRMPETTIRAICLVTMTGGASPDTGIRLARELRLETSDAHIVALLLPGQSEATGQAKAELRESVDHIASSYEQLVLDLQAQAGREGAVDEHDVRLLRDRVVGGI